MFRDFEIGSNQLDVGSIPTRPTIKASIVKSLRCTPASLEDDVVPLSAMCPIGALKPPQLTAHGCLLSCMSGDVAHVAIIPALRFRKPDNLVLPAYVEIRFTLRADSLP
jgi:hypothetical protein